MSRRLLLLVLVVLALPALALAAATDPTKQINPVDQRKAASIVLMRPDVIVPGWKKVAVIPEQRRGSRLPRVQPRPIRPHPDRRGREQLRGRRDQGRLGVQRLQDQARCARLVDTACETRSRSLPRSVVQAGDRAGRRQSRDREVRPDRFPEFAPRTAAFRVSMTVSYTDAGKTTTVPFTAHVVVLGNGRGDASAADVRPRKRHPERRPPRVREARRRAPGCRQALTAAGQAVSVRPSSASTYSATRPISGASFSPHSAPEWARISPPLRSPSTSSTARARAPGSARS